MSSNGTSASIKVIGFVLAILGAGITVYSVFHAPLAQAIAKETECRREADVALTEKLTDAIGKQQQTNETTNIVLAKMLVELEYIKKAVK